MDVVERFIHNDTRASRPGRFAQDFPCHSVRASGPIFDLLEELHRIDRHALPRDERKRLQPDNVHDELQVGRVVIEIAIQGQERCEIHQMQRVG